jgi:hypothetical protein
MPFVDPEKKRKYQRDWVRGKRGRQHKVDDEKRDDVLRRKWK